MVSSPHLSTTTGQLVRAACDHEPAAWTELVARYQGLVRAVVGSFRLQDADAADAVQNTWVRALERLDSLREADRLGGWLSTVARRECLALLARSGREMPSELDRMDLTGADPGPEAVVLAAEARRAVSCAVADLPPRRRDLVHALFYRPERNYADVAAVMGMPVGSIGPTRQRTLRMLESGLVGAGV